MSIEAAIDTLNAVIRSIRESIWLIDISSEETKIDEPSPQFHSRIGNILSNHLKETIATVEYAQSLLKRIEQERSNQLPSQSSSMTDSDRSIDS